MIRKDMATGSTLVAVVRGLEGHDRYLLEDVSPRTGEVFTSNAIRTYLEGQGLVSGTRISISRAEDGTFTHTVLSAPSVDLSTVVKRRGSYANQDKKQWHPGRYANPGEKPRDGNQAAKPKAAKKSPEPDVVLDLAADAAFAWAKRWMREDGGYVLRTTEKK